MECIQCWFPETYFMNIALGNYHQDWFQGERLVKKDLLSQILETSRNATHKEIICMTKPKVIIILNPTSQGTPI